MKHDETAALLKSPKITVSDTTMENNVDPQTFVLLPPPQQNTDMMLSQQGDASVTRPSSTSEQNEFVTSHLFPPPSSNADDVVVSRPSDAAMHTRSFSPFFDTDSINNARPFSISSSSKFIRAIRKAERRRGSVGEGMVQRQKTISAPVQPRLTKSSTLAFSSASKSRRESDVPTWDPHIDAFEILRAKITGITRTMQEFHVQELFRDELVERRERHHTIGAYPGNRQSERRLSTCGLLSDKREVGHRRIRSQGSMTFQQPFRMDKEEQEMINSPPPPPPAPTADDGHHDPWFHLRTDEDFELRRHDDDESPSLATSPNLTALFLTTNSLINSRLDELSETASIASSCDLPNNSPAAEWRSQFLDLVSACITQSEGLESLSTELLGTERRVREFLVLNETVEEQFREREKIYEERIRECEDVAKQQLLMIDTLEELNADLEMKMEQLKRRHHHHHGNSESSDPDHDDGYSSLQSQDGDRWDFSRAVADILGIESKDDLVHKMRWEVGMFVGGGVGTGHVIHSFEGRLRGIEMMIAGSGTTVVEEDYCTGEVRKSYGLQIRRTWLDLFDLFPQYSHVSPTIRHAKFQHHQYVLHLTPEDRKTRFYMIPRAHWVPDQLAPQCQFERDEPGTRCRIRFGLFQRRHHCRR